MIYPLCITLVTLKGRLCVCVYMYIHIFTLQSQRIFAKIAAKLPFAPLSSFACVGIACFVCLTSDTFRYYVFSALCVLLHFRYNIVPESFKDVDELISTVSWKW